MDLNPSIELDQLGISDIWYVADSLEEPQAGEQSRISRKLPESCRTGVHGGPGAPRDPRLNSTALLDRKRWHAFAMLEKKESMPLARLVCLPPDLSATCPSSILDSIITVDVQSLPPPRDHSDQKKDKDMVPKHHFRKYPSSLDPAPDSHWFTDYQDSTCLWLANCGVTTDIVTPTIEREFETEPGFLGVISISGRPYVLLVFSTPEDALATWTRKNLTYGEFLEKEILADFAKVPLPPAFALNYAHRFAPETNTDTSNTREVMLDDWREVPGLVMIPNFLDEEQENSIAEAIIGPSYRNSDLSDLAEVDIRVGATQSEEDASTTATNGLLLHDENSYANWITLTKRRVLHFGYAFNYVNKSIDASAPLGPMPDFAQKVIDHLNEIIAPPTVDSDPYSQEKDTLKRVVGTNQGLKWNPDQLTVNEYRPGAGIPHHIDTHTAFKDMVVSVSILGAIVMDFCHPDGRKGRKKIYVPRRSLLVLTGEARYLWTHCITPRTTDHIRGRPIPRQTRISLTFRNIKPYDYCDCPYPPQCDYWRSAQKHHQSKIEDLHVHQVYDQIASHFDRTRYKPWPKVVAFLQELKNDFGLTPLVCDVGCGNGRYMGDDIYPQDGSFGPQADDFYQLVRVGGDRSLNLCRLSKAKNFEVSLLDCLVLPYRSNLFDAAISIAVMHHLSTVDHRVQALSELLRIVKVGGRICVYVWALNQNEVVAISTKSGTSGHDGVATGTSELIDEDATDKGRRNFGQQDVFVPWTTNPNEPVEGPQHTLMRYLHVYRLRELAELLDLINKKEKVAEILEEGIDHANCYIILKKLC